MFSDATLLDILQILSMSRSSKVLEVNYAGGKGILYMENGNIVHAISDKQMGEAAVYDCLIDDCASFKELPWERVPERTIQKPITAILLEAAIMRDEMGVGMNKTPAASHDISGKEAKPSVKKEDDLISKIGHIQSVCGAVFIQLNGEILAGVGESINNMRTLTSLVTGTGSELRDMLKCSKTEKIIINLADGRKAMIMSSKKLHLCVLIEKDGVIDLITKSIVNIFKNESGA